MKTAHHTARIYIDDQHVGDIDVSGWHGSWGLGQFRPNDLFEAYRPLFAEWSRLMHADAGPISDDVSQRLRELECQMYTLRCKLFLVQLHQWRQVLILNIDREMIEWKEGWVGGDDLLANAGKMNMLYA